MNEAALYKEYSWDEAVALFGSRETAQVVCDGEWVIFPGAILCLATLGDPTVMPHFETASRFWWVTDKPPVPREAIAAVGWHPTIHFFVRKMSQSTYIYVGQSGPSHVQSYPRSGGLVAAEFDLRPAIPSGVWQALGGFAPGCLDHSRVDDALRQLHGTTTTEARLATLRELAEYWHGLISSEDGFRDEELAGKEMPYPLSWWYRLAGHRTEIMSGQNLLLQPDSLEMKDGLLLFYGENQWCYEWATMPAESDPPVYGREDQSKPWTPEGMLLSEFLIQVCLFEAVMCHARYGASAAWIDADVMSDIAKVIHPLPIAPWGWGGTQFWASNGAFAFVADNGEYQGRQGYSIWIGAKTEHPLEFLRSIVNDDWEYVSI
jgi:hypothetical protein